MPNEKVSIWKLAPQASKRFLQGHPWIFSNELLEPDKSHVPGAPVELRDSRGNFLARGYGNLNSLIAFRVLSRKVTDARPWSEESLKRKVRQAILHRRELGLMPFSFRLVFGEGDELPGLVIDRFLHESGQHQVLVMQMLTQGIERAISNPWDWVQSWCSELDVSVQKTSLVVRRDVGARRAEGLETVAAEIFGSPQEFENFPMQLRKAATQQESLILHVNLTEGQKTGFFFDQSQNVDLAVMALERANWLESARMKGTDPLLVLDLFCYVGQWGAQILAAYQSKKREPTEIKIDFVDGSRAALQLASANAQLQVKEKKNSQLQTRALELDVMDGLAKAQDSHVVICDPPAFIKAKKDHASGLKGYVKVNMMALNKVLPGGLFVTCSCSHHLSEEDFELVLVQAADRTGRKVHWLTRGLQSPDHPINLAFPEGRYLKCWIGRVD